MATSGQKSLPKPTRHNFQPLYNRILVERIEAEDVTTGGIVIPDAAKEKPAIGIVVSVGHGVPERNGKLRALYVKRGQIVTWSQYSGQEVSLEDGEFVVIAEEDLLGVVK